MWSNKRYTMCVWCDQRKNGNVWTEKNSDPKQWLEDWIWNMETTKKWNGNVFFFLVEKTKRNKNWTSMSVIHINSETECWMLNAEHEPNPKTIHSHMQFEIVRDNFIYCYPFSIWFSLFLLAVAIMSFGSNQFGFFLLFFVSICLSSFDWISSNCAQSMYSIYMSDATMNGMFSFCFESIFHMLGIFCCCNFIIPFQIYICSGSCFHRHTPRFSMLNFLSIFSRRAIHIFFVSSRK